MNVVDKVKERIQMERDTKDRAIVFWYDPQEQVELETLQEALADVAVRVLTDRNFFRLKVEIEREKRDQSFLIYAPFVRPEDSQNQLLDILSYSAEFKADETAILSEQLGVSDGVLRPMMEQYPFFFDSKERKKKLEGMLPEHADAEAFERSMMAVLTKAAVPDLRVIARQLLSDDLSLADNLSVKQLKRNFSLARTFEMVGRYFGVSLDEADEPLEALQDRLIYQHFKAKTDVLFDDWEADWVSSSPNVCRLFTEEWLQQTPSLLEDRIKAWERHHGVGERLARLDISQIQEVDTFPVVDQLIIEKVIDELTHETIQTEARLTLLDARLNTHWGQAERIQPVYQAVYQAILLEQQKPLLNRLYQEDDLYTGYAKELYQIDQTYRHFMHHYAMLEAKERLEEIASRLTNWYEHHYLAKVAEASNAKLEEESSSTLLRQQTFFNKRIKPILEKEPTRVFVIISDALRYEAGHELAEMLSERENGTAELEAMSVSLPTYTQLGMASLLPYGEMTIDEQKTILSNGRSTRGLGNRKKILQEVEEDTEVMKLKELLDRKAGDAEQLLRGKRLVYLYHDHIDALGDSAKSERETYGAVDQAIRDLAYAVDRLSRLQARRIFITADHGFIFQFKQIEEHGKIPAVDGDVMDGSRRFAIGSRLTAPEGAIKLKPGQTSIQNAEVVLAKGLNRFKTGGGLQFIHGGALPQEAVVPLIDYRRIEKAKPVDVTVAMVNKVITNYRLTVSFYQEQSVSDAYAPRKLRAAFYQGEERISNAVELVFDHKGDHRERTKQAAFQLVENHYKIGETCTLRLETVTAKGQEHYHEDIFTLRLYEALY